MRSYRTLAIALGFLAATFTTVALPSPFNFIVLTVIVILLLVILTSWQAVAAIASWLEFTPWWSLCLGVLFLCLSLGEIWVGRIPWLMGFGFLGVSLITLLGRGHLSAIVDAATEKARDAEHKMWQRQTEADRKQRELDLDNLKQVRRLQQNFRVLFNKGQLSEAIACLSQAIRIDPQLLALYQDRASALGVQGRYEEAIADVSKLLEFEPYSTSLLIRRAGLYLSARQVQNSISDWTRTIEIDPSANHYTGRASFRLTAALNSSGGPGTSRTALLDEALTDASHASDRDPNNVQAWEVRRSIHEALGERDSVLSDLTRLISLQPDRSWRWRDRADYYFRIGRVEVAAADMAEAIRVSHRGPERSQNLARRAEMFMQMERWENAITDLTKAVCEQEAPIVARLNLITLSDVLYRLGRDTEAISWLRKAIDIPPANGEPAPLSFRPHLAAAWILATCPDEKLRDGPEALRLARRAIGAMKPGDLTMVDHMVIGAAFARGGCFSEAVEQTRQGISCCDRCPFPSNEFVLKLKGMESQFRNGEAFLDDDRNGLSLHKAHQLIKPRDGSDGVEANPGLAENVARIRAEGVRLSLPPELIEAEIERAAMEMRTGEKS